VIHTPTAVSPHLVCASVSMPLAVDESEGCEWFEAPISSIFCVQLGDTATADLSAAGGVIHSSCACFALWEVPLPPRVTVPRVVPRGDSPPRTPSAACMALAAGGLLARLAYSVGVRVATVPPPPRTPTGCAQGGLEPARVAVLFSGGIDSMVVAALSHFFVPPEEPIDLVNVCFAEDHASPDRLTACTGVHELRVAYPSRCCLLRLLWHACGGTYASLSTQVVAAHPSGRGFSRHRC